MSSFLAVMKVAAINQYVQWLPSLDAVSGTNGLLKKVTNAAQVVGFTGAIAVGAGCFALMAWASERWRDRIKTHLIWVFISVIGLFAIAAIATMFKAYSKGSFN